MKRILTLISLSFAAVLSASAQGTDAFSFQGHLSDAGNPANGIYQMTFTLFDASVNGSPIRPTITNFAVGFTNGNFSAVLDFGPQVFNGPPLWLEVAIRPDSTVAFTNLTPRQPILPTPYALHSEVATLSGGVSNAVISAYSLNTIAQPASGQILSYNGSTMSWINAGSSLTVPFSGAGSSASPLLTLQNTGSGPAAAFLGNVGIGTSTPVGKLQVYGNSGAGPHIPTDTSLVASGDGFHNRFMSVFGDQAGYLSMWHQGYGEVSTYDYSNHVGLPLIFNSNGGNVGIGTVAPAAQLDVFSRSNNLAAISGASFSPGFYGRLGGSYTTGGDFPLIYNFGVYGNGGVASTLASASLNYAGYFDGPVTVQGNFLATGGDSRFYENVGIGTPSAPAARLDVEATAASGNFTTPVAIIRNNSAGNNAAPSLTLFGSGNTSAGVFCVSTSGTGLIAEFGNALAFVADIRTNGTIDAVSFNSTSDRNLKENFSAVSADAVLEKVVSLPISQWNFKADGGTRHIGPMAQDFYAAFSVGSDDKHIATVDEDGVALAAIQGLNQKIERQNAELKSKDTELEHIKDELAQLKKMVGKLANAKEDAP